MQDARKQLEEQLNDFNPERRAEALEGLLDLVRSGSIELPDPGPAVNLHCHTFFSYNGYGFSPSCYAWKARCAGLYMGGVVDFDVLDAVDEFLSAAGRVGLKACAGVETRIYVPEFGSRVMNSPGEPGIAYHMGVGFTSSAVGQAEMLDKMKDTARERTVGILERVNPFLDPVTVDYDRDVLPLTPRGNATERHLCQAYETKSAEVFPDREERAAFWASKLGGDKASMLELLGDSPSLQGLIRSKTMKRGGVGYVQPDGRLFPKLDEVNQFVLNAGAVPTFAFLDGTTEGEQAMDELLDLQQGAGTAAVNIIPDRNWNIKDPAEKETKVAFLNAFVENATNRDLPIVVGTEMNAFGQLFVDDFSAPEMQAHAETFLKGADIMYAHTALQSAAGLGYLSGWARQHFDTAAGRNEFYARLGRKLPAGDWTALEGLTADASPPDILASLD